MAENRSEMRIPMQVGTEFRIRNNGDIILDNPELELAADTAAADAVLSYRFDSESGEHVLRLLDPVAERALRQDRSEEHTSELQSRQYLVCRLLLEKKKCH